MGKPNNVRQLQDIANVRAAQFVASQFGAQRAQSELREAQSAKDSVEAARHDSEMQWRKALERPLLPIDALVAWSAEIQRQNAKFEIAQTAADAKRHFADQTQSAWHIADVVSDRASDAVRSARSRAIDARDESRLEDVLEKIAFRGARP